MDEAQITAAIAAVAAVAGAFAKGFWAAWKAKKDDSAVVQTAQIADEGKLRGELWDRMTELQTRMDTRIDAMQLTLDKSREEYIVLLGEHALLKAEHAALKSEHENLKIRYAAFELRVNSTN